MSLPNYNDFKKLKQERLKAEAILKNKRHYDYAEAFYVLIEKDLARGYDTFSTNETELKAPWDDNWIYILSEKCEKEDWIVKSTSPYCKWNFTLKHKKDHNWLTRLFKGWN